MMGWGTQRRQVFQVWEGEGEGEQHQQPVVDRGDGGERWVRGGWVRKREVKAVLRSVKKGSGRVWVEGLERGVMVMGILIIS